MRGTKNQVERFGAVNRVFARPTVDELSDALFCFSKVPTACDKQFFAVSQYSDYFERYVLVFHGRFNFAYFGQNSSDRRHTIP